VLSLSYGKKVEIDSICREGISGIAQKDIEFAKELGYKIKLLAIARERGEEVEARIHPTMIPFNHLLANVNGNFNAFHFVGDASDSVFLYGQGSGMMPTASAVVSDLVDIARNILKGSAGGAGQGEGGAHELESNAYDLGRILTEQFKLPNLKDKGKKRSLTRYTYDLTDKNRGFGQILDKKATLRRILQTNIGLGRISGQERVDPLDLMIAPRDRVYRILSREKDYESQAVVFFVRDYSGSMSGKPTELIVSQHVLIYSWLAYQYQNQVMTRFILHDTEAREVVNFHTYANLRVAGGTQVASAYRLVNKLVERENCSRITTSMSSTVPTVMTGDTKGEETLPELRRMLRYAARVGITIAENGYGVSGKSEVERYVRKSGLLDERNDLLRLDVMAKDSNEGRVIEGIKHLIS